MLRQTALRKTGLAAAAASALIAIGVPLALAAPTALPSDGEGYVNSTARCTAPDTAVLFGSTETSRVAICKTASGSYQYRGVRVSDGARLITAASQTSANAFVADNDGVKYTVTPTALSVTSNGNTFRTETWTDYHGPQAPASSTSTSAKPSTSSSATPTTSGTATPSTSGTASPSPSSSAPKTSSAQPSSTAPLPPPMPAEVGGGSSSGE